MITRGVKNKMIHSKIINEEMDESTPIEHDQLKMWEHTSFNDIKLARNLKFILNKSNKEFKI